MANLITRYIQESKEELKKVTWPSRQQVTRDTMVVIGISVAVAAFFGAIDYGLMELFRYYI